MKSGEIREYFCRAKKSGKLSHAYILEDESGREATELAQWFAALLECENGSACGTCSACRACAGGNHPDVLRISHEKPDSIGVDEIRAQLVDDILIRPYSGPYKVYLVPEAEKLTVQAQNALLKTLEEPPSYGVILLLTANGDKLLPTIRSRGILLKLTEEEQTEALLPPEERELVLSLLRQAGRLTVTQMADGAKSLREHRVNVSALAALVRAYLRDVLVLKATGKADLLQIPEELSACRELAERLPYKRLHEIWKETDRMESRLLSNVNYELALELLFMAMKG